LYHVYLLTDQVRKIPSEKSLQKKVFEACDSIEQTGEEITLEQVREQTGGSDRNLSRYINEWKAAKETAITVAGSSEISPQEQELVAINDESVPDSVPSAQIYSTTPQDDLEKVARRGAERAAAILVGEDAVAAYLLENPDQLPADLRAKVEATRAKVNQTVERRQEEYEPDFFAQMAIAMFQ